MKRHHYFLTVIIKALTDNQDCFPVEVAGSIRKTNICSKGYIARHFFPEITEFIAGIPNIITGRSDGVLFCFFIIAAGASYQCTTYITLTVEDAN